VQIGKTGYRALDELVEQANMPKRCDRPLGAMLYGHLLGRPCSEHTFRRLSIRCIKTGRSISYLVDDIVAAARKAIAEAPDCTPPERPRKKRIRPATTQSPPAATHEREAAGQHPIV
jgi:hypothetical protein